MKSTGIVRKIDNLGRVVLPMELRKTMDIGYDAAIEIFTDENFILLKKYQPSCVFCGEAENVISYKDKNVCPDCAEELKAVII